MGKWTTLILLYVCSIGTLFAQTRTITGKVLSSEDGEPVIGASIRIEGTTTGTITNFDGDFSLNVPADAKVLTVSYIGMKTATFPIQSRMAVKLDPDTQMLNEIVVVAYGQQRKEAITGAIAQVKSEAIEKRPVSAATAVLEGQALGVQVNNSYGEPGQDAKIRIRGTNSINGSNEPLYVVNGVPMGGNVSDLNSADIESITVLKDAASAALYGNRAANGVVIITTKGGRLGEENLSIQANVNMGVYQRGIKDYERLNAGQYMEAYWMARRNALYTDDTKGAYSTWADANADANIAAREGLVYNIFNKDWENLYDATGKLSSGTEILSGYSDDLDWYDAIERTGTRNEYSLNARGGSKKATYYMSVGYLKEDGYMKASGMERITGSIKIDLTPAKWLKIGVSMNGSNQALSRMSGSAVDNATSFINPFYSARNMAPVYPVHLHDATTGAYIVDDNGGKIYDSGANGELIRPQSNNRHIAWETELDKNRTYRTTIDGIVYADISFLNDFVLSIKGNLNNRNQSRKTYNNAIVGDGAGQGRMGQTDYRYRNYLVQQLLTWNHEFDGVHHVDALVGHEGYSYGYQYGYLYKTDEKFAGLMELSNFSTMSSVLGYQNDYNNEGYFLRTGYNYDQKYFGEFSFRRDGSSRFHKDNRWGNFWSVGGSWVMSHENFIKQIHWIDHLKLRAAYGEVGSDGGNSHSDISYYAWMELYYSDKNGGDGALYRYQNGAESVNWEKTKSMSVALESRLFKRANFTIEYYDKTSDDLLFNVSLPSSMGSVWPDADTPAEGNRPTVLKNFGSISNRGFELGFDVDIIQRKDFNWNVGMNFNLPDSKVKKLPKEYGDNGYISGILKYQKGHDVYSFWLYQYMGIDREDGRSLYRLDDESYYIADDGYTGPGSSGNGTEGRTKMAAANYKIIDGVAYVYNTTYAKKGWCGSALANIWGSFSTSLNYRRFALSGLFTYQLGSKMYDYSYAALMRVIATPSAAHKDVLKSWTPEQAGTGLDPNGVPALNSSLSSNNNAQSDRFLIDTDYFTIKNITLSYSVPRKTAGKIGLQEVVVSASVENLATFTKLQGIAPQQSWNGVNNNGYVPARVMSMGLNVKF